MADLFRLLFAFSISLIGSVLRAEPLLEEHLRQLGADRFHARQIDGRGVTIAVLDTGFQGYREQLGKALPATVVTRSFRVDRNLDARGSLHGLTCAEIIHAIAPGARLLLANWEPDSPRHFLEAVRWAKAQGAQLISCSVVMPGWSDGRGGGDIHRLLRETLGEPDQVGTPLLVAAVGNFAERHLTVPFHDTGNRLHRWPDGSTELQLTPWGGGPVCVELTHSSRATYRLEIRDPEGRVTGTRFGPAAEGIHGQSIRFFPDRDAYSVRVEKLRGEEGEAFRLISLGASPAQADSCGSAAFPGDGLDVIGVGAVDERGQRASYSGCGYDVGKPDCVAVVPFPTQIQPAFGGTSAATPQAAALAALLWGANPRATAQWIRRSLLKSCRDVGPRGVDRETGQGVIGLAR